MDATMPRRRKLVKSGSSPTAMQVASRLHVLGLNPAMTRDQRPGERINCRVVGNVRNGEAGPLVSVGYVRVLPDGGVRLAGLRSAHQCRVSLALQASKIRHQI
jgi:hypothetical protein